MDGYPDGHGQELKEFLSGKSICNGISFGTGEDNTKKFNGMGCLAASLVKHFKDGIGQFYLYSHKTKARQCGAEYTYTVYKKNSAIYLRAYDVYDKKVIYDGAIDSWEIKQEG